jgi:hypothetical protein
VSSLTIAIEPPQRAKDGQKNGAFKSVEDLRDVNASMSSSKGL